MKRLVVLILAGFLVFAIGACKDENPVEKPQPIPVEKPDPVEKPVVMPVAKEGEILLFHDCFPSHKKGPVLLSHDKHSKDYGVACDDCHHVYEAGVNVWKEGDDVQSCNSCHNIKTTVGKNYKLQIAFHKNCKTCHKEKSLEAGSEIAPYKKCSGCHLPKPK